VELDSIYSNQADYIQSLVRYQHGGFVYGLYQGHLFNSVFQPIVDRTGELFAFEGLVRIKDSLNNMIHTGDYFSSLKPGDKANVVTTLLCAKLHSINLAHTPHRDRKLFINVSPSVFSLLANHLQAIEYLLLRLKCLRMSCSQIVYEITEFEDSDLSGIVKGKQRLAEHGIATALDDYGTHYSTRARALQIRSPYLKIDRSFVGDQQFVRHAVELAQQIGAKTIAEGIETEQEYWLCRECGVDYFQGYWVARPMESQKLEQY